MCIVAKAIHIIHTRTHRSSHNVYQAIDRTMIRAHSQMSTDRFTCYFSLPRPILCLHQPCITRHQLLSVPFFVQYNTLDGDAALHLEYSMINKLPLLICDNLFNYCPNESGVVPLHLEDENNKRMMQNVTNHQIILFSQGKRWRRYHRNTFLIQMSKCYMQLAFTNTVFISIFPALNFFLLFISSIIFN